MTNKRPTEGETVSLLGIIIPSDWDMDGKAIAYMLSTFDEKEYRIRQYDPEPDIQYFLGEKVIVKGTLRREDNNQMLHVETIWPF